MALFDRFKAQPGWRHADGPVRAAAVADLTDDQVEVLTDLARNDPDPLVRRTATARLKDVTLLGTLAGHDSDERVRAEARARLLSLALTGDSAELAAAALGSLADPRDIATVAKQASWTDVARQALGRMTDLRQVSAAARQAAQAEIRLEALARLTDPAELMEVAAKTDHRDVGLAALDRLTDQALLETVGTRARNKAVARRAKALVRALEMRPKPEGPEERRMRFDGLCAAAEALRTTSDRAEGDHRLALLEDQWATDGRDADDAHRARFEAAVAAARARLDELARVETEVEEAVRVQRAGIERRQTLCEEIEGLHGETAPSRLAELTAEWQGLPELDPTAETPWTARFAAASAACEERYRTWSDDQRRLGRLAALAEEAREAAALEDLQAASPRFAALRTEWAALASKSVPDAAGAMWASAETAMEQREGAIREERVKRARENLLRWQRVCERLDKLVASESMTLKEGERALRECRTPADQLDPFPSRQARDQVVERLRSLHAALYPKVQEAREIEDWKRWANVGIQEELCRKAEALGMLVDTNPAEVARQLRQLRQQWSTASTVPASVSQQLWRRFKVATDDARVKCEAFFAKEGESRQGNLQAKLALCEKAEALSGSSDWIKTAVELQALQQEWKAIGPVPREQAKETFARFRSACDAFFTRRKADLTERREVWSVNQAKKEALCERAEAVADATDWANTAAVLKQLQAEWKTVGPVKRTKAEALWKRFRAASDKFFERYKNRDEIDVRGRILAREQLCQDMEALAPGDEAGAALPVDVVAKVRALWTSWRQSAPIPREAADALQRRFEAALSKVVSVNPELFRRSDLDLEANQRRMEQLCAQVEALASGRRSPTDLGAAPAATLATLLREALAANTIGGRVDADAQQRATREAVRELQEAWKRIGPVPGDVGRQLSHRFHQAARRFYADTPPRREGPSDRGQGRGRGPKPRPPSVQPSGGPPRT